MKNRVSCKSHCCLLHGCKYGYEDCPVTQGEVLQDYPCEQCADSAEEARERILNAESAYHRAWREYDFYVMITTKED